MLYAFWPSELHQRAVGVLLVVEEFFIPLLILSYCYGRIIWILTKRLDTKLHTTNISSNDDQFHLAKKNTVKTFLIISICFIICWSNSQVFYLLFNLGFNFHWEGTYSKFATLMAFGNCTVNPFIYLIKYKDYQTALKSCFNCNERKSGNQHIQINTSLMTDVSCLISTVSNSTPVV